MKMTQGLFFLAAPWLAWAAGTGTPAPRQGPAPPAPPWGIGLHALGAIRLPQSVWDLVQDELELAPGEVVQGVIADLNADGRSDFLVRASDHLCGNGGCPFRLVEGLHRRIIGRFHGLPLYVQARRVRGFPVIETWNRLNARGGTWTTWVFDGAEYRVASRRELAGPAADSLFRALESIPVLPQATDPPGADFALDHNRIIVGGRFPTTREGSVPVRVWVDTGNPELWISAALAARLGVMDSTGAAVSPGGLRRLRSPLPALEIGGVAVPLAGVNEALIVPGRGGIGPGLPADINLPSTVLRRLDLLIDYPARRLTLGPPGTVPLPGVRLPVTVNPSNGLIQVPVQIAGTRHHLGLDLGASITLVSDAVMRNWSREHPDWPRMTGAVGIANMWGLDDEPGWSLVRIPEVGAGPVRLTGVAASAIPPDLMEGIALRAGMATSGLLGANAVRDRRVGIDYAKQEIVVGPPDHGAGADLDVVGLTLRPEPGGPYTVRGVATLQGRPAVPGLQVGDTIVSIDGVPLDGNSMGQVWVRLGGAAGTRHQLVVRRGGPERSVSAGVHRFLGTGPSRFRFTPR